MQHCTQRLRYTATACTHRTQPKVTSLMQFILVQVNIQSIQSRAKVLISTAEQLYTYSRTAVPYTGQTAYPAFVCPAFLYTNFGIVSPPVVSDLPPCLRRALRQGGLPGFLLGSLTILKVTMSQFPRKACLGAVFPGRCRGKWCSGRGGRRMRKPRACNPAVRCDHAEPGGHSNSTGSGLDERVGGVTNQTPASQVWLH